MKHISTVTILALCAVIPVHAKQVGKKTTPVQQPQIQTIPRTIQPQPMPQPRPQQPKIVQPTEIKQEPQEEYKNILNQLEKLEPSTNDWNVLKQIKEETIKQMNKAYNPELSKKS